MAAASAMVFVLVSAANPEAMASPSWMDWISPRYVFIACFILYNVYSLLVGGGSPEDKAFSEKFLAENKAKEGVVTLASGLQYKVLRAGNGDSHPLPSSPCACHYEGRCCKDWPSGKKFDSSYDRGSPTTFAPNQVIAGWTEAMQLMVEGDKWEMYIPAKLACASQLISIGRLHTPLLALLPLTQRLSPRFADGDTGRVPGCLVFTMEIIKINGGKKPKVKKDD